MKTRFFIVAVALLVGVASPVGAQTPDDAFHRGNDAYRSGQFAEAAKEYESILRQGLVSPEIYFNLGNTYYRMGRLSGAILSFERASRLRPGDPDIAYNLRLVNLRTMDHIDPVPELFLLQWLRSASSFFSAATTANLFAGSWAAFFVALSLMYLVTKPGFLKAARIVMLISAVLVMCFGALLALQNSQLNTHDTAIVTASVVTAKSSPDEQSVDAFVVHEGLKVHLSDAVGDWVKITLADGKVGWVRNQQCERI